MFLVLTVVAASSVRANDAGRRASDQNVAERRDCAGRTYAELRTRFLRDGHCTFTSCSLREQDLSNIAGLTRLEASRKGGTPQRDRGFARPVATDPDTLSLLHFIMGHKPLPFQTLNFAYGTERRTHSDVVHFDTLPRRGMMAASWLALEDVH
eukprot:2506117-Prymnesium_polylepis.1